MSRDRVPMPPAANAVETKASVDPFVARILKHQKTLDSEITTAKGDSRGIAALVSTDLKGLELQARLAGRLESGASQVVGVEIVMLGQASGPARPRVAGDNQDPFVIDIITAAR